MAHIEPSNREREDQHHPLSSPAARLVRVGTAFGGTDPPASADGGLPPFWSDQERSRRTTLTGNSSGRGPKFIVVNTNSASAPSKHRPHLIESSVNRLNRQSRSISLRIACESCCNVLFTERTIFVIKEVSISAAFKQRRIAMARSIPPGSSDSAGAPPVRRQAAGTRSSAGISRLPGQDETPRTLVGRAGQACAGAAGDSGHEPVNLNPTRLWTAVIRLERSLAAQRALLDSLLTSFRQCLGAAPDLQQRLDLVRTRQGTNSEPRGRPPTA